MPEDDIELKLPLKNNALCYLLSTQHVPQNGGIVLLREWGRRAKVEGGVTLDALCFGLQAKRT